MNESLDKSQIEGRPAPLIDVDNAPFFEGCAKGELLLQRCVDTGIFQFYPRPFSVQTAGRIEWVKASGRGSVYSFSVVRQNFAAPQFQPLLPYVVALVDLDEGVRVMGNVIDCTPEDVTVGAPVRAVFKTIDSEQAIYLPFWQLADRHRG